MQLKGRQLIKERRHGKLLEERVCQKKGWINNDKFRNLRFSSVKKRPKGPQEKRMFRRRS